VHDPTANLPLETNIGVPHRVKNEMDIERRGRAAYLFVRGGWWMEGKVGVPKFSGRTNFDLDYLRQFPFPRPTSFPTSSCRNDSRPMTGPSFIPLDSDHDAGAASLEDTPILGPKWIKLPALTVGFIGLQALWSVEMSYGAPPTELKLCATHLPDSCQPRRICYPWGYQNPSWPLYLLRGRYPASSFSPSLVQSTASSFDHLRAHIVQRRSAC
jgi:hypothetical protein